MLCTVDADTSHPHVCYDTESSPRTELHTSDILYDKEIFKNVLLKSHLKTVGNLNKNK